MLQSKANLSSAEVGKIQELLQLSTQYSKEAETYSVALKDAETSEAFLSSTIWAKPHETRGKMSVPEAEDLLSKISIKPSTSLFSSDVDWISEGSKENLRKLGLKADTLESTILQLENLKSNLGTWKRSSLKLTPSLGSQQSATALSQEYNRIVVTIHTTSASLVEVLKKDLIKTKGEASDVIPPREYFVRSMTPAERSHPFGKSVYKLKYGNETFEICGKGVIFDRNELAVIGDDVPDRRKFKEYLLANHSNVFGVNSNPYVENFKHLSNQINQREKQIGDLLNDITGEIPHVDPRKNQENSERSLQTMMTKFAEIKRIRGEKFKFLEGGEDESGYSGPSAGFTGPGTSGPSSFPSGGGGSNVGGGTPGSPGGSNPSGPGFTNPGQGGGATPAGNPGNFSSQQTTGAGPASVPSNQPKPGNPPNQIIDFKSDNKAGQTRPPMGPPK